MRHLIMRVENLSTYRQCFVVHWLTRNSKRALREHFTHLLRQDVHSFYSTHSKFGGSFKATVHLSRSLVKGTQRYLRHSKQHAILETTSWKAPLQLLLPTKTPISPLYDFCPPLSVPSIVKFYIRKFLVSKTIWIYISFSEIQIPKCTLYEQSRQFLQATDNPIIKFLKVWGNRIEGTVFDSVGNYPADRCE